MTLSTDRIGSSITRTWNRLDRLTPTVGFESLHLTRLRQVRSCLAPKWTRLDLWTALCLTKVEICYIALKNESNNILMLHRKNYLYYEVIHLSLFLSFTRACIQTQAYIIWYIICTKSELEKYGRVQLRVSFYFFFGFFFT